MNAMKSPFLLFFVSFSVFFFLFFSFALEEDLMGEEGVDYVPGQVIVRLRQNPEDRSEDNLGKLSSGGNMVVVRSLDGLEGVHAMASKVGQSVQEMIGELHQNSNVIFAEPDYYLSSIPIDQDEDSSEEEKEDTFEKSSFNFYEEELEVASPGPNVPIVAVIDSGVDPNYSGFIRSKALWTNTKEISNNNRDDDNNGYVDDKNGWNFLSQSHSILDDDGHGTHVAGIVLRVHLGLFNQNFSYPSLSQPSVQIMNLKFSSLEKKGTISRAAAAIRYAVDNGAKVINASWVNHHYSRTLHEAISYAYEKKVAFIASAGNDGQINKEEVETYPSDLDVPNIISVAALNVSLYEFLVSNPNESVSQKKKHLASFSNYGVNAVHVAAPGSRVKSALSTDAKVDCPLSICSYISMSGTSMAAPVVAGLASFILSHKPTLSGYDIQQNILKQYANEVPELEDKLITGASVDIERIFEVESGEEFIAFAGQPSYSLEDFGKRVSASVDGPNQRNDGFQPDKLFKS